MSSVSKSCSSNTSKRSNFRDKVPSLKQTKSRMPVHKLVGATWTSTPCALCLEDPESTRFDEHNRLHPPHVSDQNVILYVMLKRDLCWNPKPLSNLTIFDIDPYTISTLVARVAAKDAQRKSSATSRFFRGWDLSSYSLVKWDPVRSPALKGVVVKCHDNNEW